MWILLFIALVKADCIDCSQCGKCMGKQILDSGEVRVTVDFSNCKSGENISWACCMSDNCELERCDGQNYDYQKNKCNELTSIEFLVSDDTTDITVQVHDGRFHGNKECTREHPCCGGSGSSCAPSGVCEVNIPLTSCPSSRNIPECTIDNHCQHLNDACAFGVCNNGVCDQAFHPTDAICRLAVDACDAPELCTGVSAHCPSDIKRDKGYTFKCGTTQYVCAMDPNLIRLKPRGNSYEVGSNDNVCIIGTGSLFVVLPWPQCVTQCLNKTCPNNKDISNYSILHCDNEVWQCLLKADVTLDTYVPVCPYNEI